MTYGLTKSERAILNATKHSENAQTARELTDESDLSKNWGTRAIQRLERRGILEPFESYDDRTVYGYQENALAQAVYCDVHQVEPIE